MTQNLAEAFRTYGPQNVTNLMHNFGTVTLNNISAITHEKTHLHMVDEKQKPKLAAIMTNRTEPIDTIRSF